MEEENDAPEEKDAAQVLKNTLYALDQNGVLFCLVEPVGDGVQALTRKKLEEVKRLLSSCHVKLRSSTGDIIDVDRNHSAHTNIDADTSVSSLDDLRSVISQLPDVFFDGEVVAISGQLFTKNEMHTEQEALDALINGITERGGVVRGTVTKDTSFLILGSRDVGENKLAKAKRLGRPQGSISDFFTSRKEYVAQNLLPRNRERQDSFPPLTPAQLPKTKPKPSGSKRAGAGRSRTRTWWTWGFEGFATSERWRR
jgi:hypothetical protein